MTPAQPFVVSRAPSPSPSHFPVILTPSPTQSGPHVWRPQPQTCPLSWALCPCLRVLTARQAHRQRSSHVGRQFPHSRAQSLVKPVVYCHRNSSQGRTPPGSAPVFPPPRGPWAWLRDALTAETPASTTEAWCEACAFGRPLGALRPPDDHVQKEAPN